MVSLIILVLQQFIQQILSHALQQLIKKKSISILYLIILVQLFKLLVSPLLKQSATIISLLLQKDAFNGICMECNKQFQLLKQTILSKQYHSENLIRQYKKNMDTSQNKQHIYKMITFCFFHNTLILSLEKHLYHMRPFLILQVYSLLQTFQNNAIALKGYINLQDQ